MRDGMKFWWVLAATLAVTTATATAAEIRVHSGGAPEAALRALAPQFEKTSGHRVTFTFAIVNAIQKRLASGEKTDLIFLPVPLIAETEKSVPLRKEGRGILARVGLAVVVRDGATRPDISSADAVRKLLTSAKTIALSEASTPGGGYVLRMLDRLGIAAETKSRLIHRAAIKGGGELVAKGEAEVGLYLRSEMQTVKGVTLVGLLPPELLFNVVYGTAIPADNPAPELALSFIKFITAPEQAGQWQQAGFELAPPPAK